MSKSAVGLLTICRKAGKLAIGFDPSKEAAVGGKAFCLLISADISDKTLKEVRFFAKDIPLLCTGLTTEETANYINKKMAVGAVTDEGFARRFIELLSAPKDLSGTAAE